MSQLEQLYAWVHRAMEIVTSADRAYRYIRENFGPVTRAEVRQAWREVGEKEAWRTVHQTWGEERAPRKEWAVERHTRGEDRWMQLITAEIYDPERQEFREEVYSIVYRQPHAWTEAIEDATEAIEESAGAWGYVILGMTIGGLVHLNPGA